ncbi:hypothetical protein PUN28_006985 [Cardiocondyla obscurior]|uniref:Uncharacterized protein n=1 Tax=Cardiocondyla obscurior TaxID=286306 RepID=A0AAW2G601_9HYME
MARRVSLLSSIPRPSRLSATLSGLPSQFPATHVPASSSPCWHRARQGRFIVTRIPRLLSPLRVCGLGGGGVG